VSKDQILFVIEQEPFVAEVSAAQAAVDRATAELDLAETTVERAQVAFDKGGVTELELKERQAQRDVKQAAVKLALAALVQAELDLDYTEIRSPVDGRASRELVDAGNLVGAGENTLLTTIVVDDPIYAYFTASERQVLDYLHRRSEEGPGAARPAAEVMLQLANGVTYELPGTVNFADNRVDPKTGTLEIRAIFPNPTGMLATGLFGRVMLPRDLGEVLLVPELAIQRDIVGPFLLVVNAEGVVERREVVLGPIAGRRRVVEAGIEATDRVIVNGLQRARAGVVVRAIDEGSAGPNSPAPAPSS
jgi:RND family efflux transporter MFP subunit